MATKLVYADDKDKLWATHKVESNGVRTVLMHALMRTRGLIARLWQQGLELGAVEKSGGLAIVLKPDKAYSGSLVFDISRHRIEMGFAYDWPRMNTMPEWFTIEPDQTYGVKAFTSESRSSCAGRQRHNGLAVTSNAEEEKLLWITW